MWPGWLTDYFTDDGADFREIKKECFCGEFKTLSEATACAEIETAKIGGVLYKISMPKDGWSQDQILSICFLDGRRNDWLWAGKKLSKVSA